MARNNPPGQSGFPLKHGEQSGQITLVGERHFVSSTHMLVSPKRISCMESEEDS